jgi:A/G-specific adenine glycosylase
VSRTLSKTGASNGLPDIEGIWSPNELSRFRRRLLAWFRKNARPLPWRENRDPYRVWISEIMLQQTQVATVGPYFQRFVERFPHVSALAAADERDVLRLWEGLGYYRRARQLHAAARLMVDRHGDSVPDSAEELLGLPGIGRYTAGAILSIAFDQRVPILEANTKRLLARLTGFRGDPDSSTGQRFLWGVAAQFPPKRGTGGFNQALMELGSLNCNSRQPVCHECPVAEFCIARRNGEQALIPPPKSKKPIEEVREAAVVVWRRGRVLLVRYEEGQRWAGLWDFPRFPLGAVSENDRRDLIEGVRDCAGVVVRPDKILTTMRHGVTRFRITLECHEARFIRSDAATTHAARQQAWVSPEEWDEYPCHGTGRRLRTMIRARQGRA